jgi:hypothetical protein
VTFFTLSNAVLNGVYHSDEPSSLGSLYEVSEFSGDSGEIEGHTSELLVQLYSGLSQHRIVLLSPLRLLRRIAPALLSERRDLSRMAQLLQMDPVLALKAYRFGLERNPANTQGLAQALSETDIGTLHRAVLLNLFSAAMEPRDEGSAQLLVGWWERAVTVAAVARQLSAALQMQQPDFAALTGLVHNIGEAAILSHVYAEGERFQPNDLAEFVEIHSKEVCEVLLTLWKVPTTMRRAVTESYHWEGDGFQGGELGDLLLLARAITLHTRQEQRSMPAPEALPVFKRLGLDKLRGSDSGLLRQLQETAADTVGEIDAFLKSLH